MLQDCLHLTSIVLADRGGSHDDRSRPDSGFEDAISRAYWSLGANEAAFELAQRALATRTQTLGPDALDTARTRHLVGQIRCSLEQCEEGSAEMLAALERLRRAAGYR